MPTALFACFSQDLPDVVVHRTVPFSSVPRHTVDEGQASSVMPSPLSPGMVQAVQEMPASEVATSSVPPLVI